jgi:hypothetical protein
VAFEDGADEALPTPGGAPHLVDHEQHTGVEGGFEVGEETTTKISEYVNGYFR